MNTIDHDPTGAAWLSRGGEAAWIGHRVRVGLTVEAAGAGDAVAILDLRHAIEDWLAEHQIRQWERGEVQLADVSGQIAAGQWHLVRDDRVRVVAALRILDSDPFWGAAPAAAVYVHGLMVHRAAAGEGVGARLLDWAGEQGRDRGAAVLRLDCVESNTRLRAYYRARGFVEVGRHDPPHPWSAVTLFERAL